MALTSIDLSVEIGVNAKLPLRMRNPVMAAAGTMGYGVEYARLIDIQSLGAICTTGITVRPRRGVRGARLAETSSGLLSATGGQNVGIRRVMEEKAPIWAVWDVPVIVNVAGGSADEYVRMAELLDGLPGVAGLELDLAALDRWDGGLQDDSVALSAGITAAVRQRTGLPVMVKISPQVSDVREVARAVENAGADAVSLPGRYQGMRIDPATARPMLAAGAGGLSGPAIRPLAVWATFLVSRCVGIPVVASGGIGSTADALEFVFAGATAIQVGTMTFVDPRTTLNIVEGLRETMFARGCTSIGDLVGLAHDHLEEAD